MLHHLIVFCLLLITCNAQEHLTCLRTDDIIYSSPRPTLNVQQGRPGRRGAPGQKGEPGLAIKGEPGIPDNSQTNSLRDELRRDLLRGYVELADGWIAPFNGYQYKATSTEQSWQEGRRICQDWGADLAVYGYRDFAVRRIIKLAILGSQGNSWFWLGLNDIETEGQWRWLNSNRAQTNVATLWLAGQPSNGAGEDCAFAYFSDSHVNGYYLFDHDCSRAERALCEKPI